MPRHVAIEWTVKIQQVYHEANCVANGIDNWSLQEFVGYHPLLVPPVQIRSLLLADVAGVSRLRFVSNTNIGM